MNWGLIGHQWAVNILRDQVSKDAVRHAYLFTGPRGIGRRTLAIRLAQALNCPNTTSLGTPCFECRICSLINRMQHPDLAIVQAEHEGRTLKVDQIRLLQHELSLSPYDAKYRVAILLRFEEASLSAANALLKTLEEPPPQVVLILSAESGEGLLPTIVSRCEVLRLRPLAVNEVNLGLANKWKLPSEQANLLAHLSGGRPGYALRLRDEPGLLDKRNQWISDLQKMIHATRVERFEYAEILAKDKDTANEVLQVWLSFWRDVLVVSIDAPIPVTNLDQEEEIIRLASQINLNQSRQFLSRIEQTILRLSRNINPRLAIEELLLDLPRTL
jgi:DNA polymerase-3 subunit delta'